MSPVSYLPGLKREAAGLNHPGYVLDPSATRRLRILAHPAHLGRWCHIRGYLDSAANHGLTTLDAITSALDGRPWLPAVPVAA